MKFDVASLRRFARPILRGCILALNNVQRSVIWHPNLPDEVRRVVLFCPYSGIGDLLLWIPALRALHGFWPGVEVILVGPSEANSLPLLKSGLIRRAIPFREVADGPLAAQTRFVRNNVRPLSPDVALCTYLEPPRRASWWALLSGARLRVGYGNQGESLLLTSCMTLCSDLHEVHRNMMLLKPLGIHGDPPPYEYHPVKEDLRWADAYLAERGIVSPRVGMHSGSNPAKREVRKRWFVDRFIGVARSLRREGVRLVVFEGPNEREDVAAIQRAMGHDIEVLRGENLGRVGAIIARLDAVIANDSALMHLSASVGTPVVAIFGPTDHIRNSPWTDKSIVLRHPCPDAPCYLKPDAPCGDRLDCLKSITVEEVLEAVHRFLNGK